MIHSMTAYARKEFKGDWGTAVWEIRSVNQRYLETYIRLPEQLRSLEPVLRERFRAKLQRGKVECNLRFEAAQAAASQLHINEELAKLIIDSANWVMKEAGQGQLNPVDVLRWPGVMAAAEQDMDAVATELLGGFDQTMEDFLASRASEGANLKALIRAASGRYSGGSEEGARPPAADHRMAAPEAHRPSGRSQGRAGSCPHRAGDRAAGPED